MAPAVSAMSNEPLRSRMASISCRIARLKCDTKVASKAASVGGTVAVGTSIILAPCVLCGDDRADESSALRV
jgi:hypothetical protein